MDRPATPGAVIIPACNEAGRIAPCLRALAPQAVRAGCRIIVVVNATQDATATIAARVLGDAGQVVDLSGQRLAGGVGQARALGFDLARRVWGAAHLFSTDADCLPGPDWLATHLASLARFDIVFGRVDPMAAELAPLAAAMGRHGAYEGLYMQAAVALAARLDPCAHDPAPAHRNPAGANLAFRAGVLDKMGGFPALPTGEDRAFARAAERCDLRLRYCGRAVVQASCRLDGRAPGGMSDALRARCEELDPMCDDWLEGADTFALRHGLRGRLRRVWPDPARLAQTLWRAGLALSAPPGRTFGAFWQDLEGGAPQLARHRLRQSDLPDQLPRLRALLADAVARDACGAPGRRAG